MNFSVDLLPQEDTNPALTCHAIIKRPQASWSQSVFSVPFGITQEKIIPNRDYPYEGLSMLSNGENFHILDGLAVGVKNAGAYIALMPEKVTVSPWKMTYFYENESERVNLRLDYYLINMGSRHNDVTACVLVDSNASSVVIEPLVDIRHMYEGSAPEEHSCEALYDGLLIRRSEHCIALRTIRDCEVRTWKRAIEWWYKLGSGFRAESESGVVFRGERKKLVSFGELEISLDNTSSALLVISCSNSESQLHALHECGKDWLHDEAEEQKRAKKLVKSLGLGVNNAAIAFRALALTKFGMYVGDEFFYEAGDFWFRTPWFRDLFEGIINNIETLIRIGDAEKIRAIIRHSFDYQDSYGRIPNRFPERQGEVVDYNNADATFLAFIAAGELLQRKEDADFANVLLERAEYTISRFRENNVSMLNGPPVLNENGLISVVPWHSWTDSRRTVELGGKLVNVPVRMPESWWKNVKDENELSKPIYWLPEINAQWLQMLRYCKKIAEKLGTEREPFSSLLEKATKSYKPIFWDAEVNTLYNIVRIDGKRDKTLGSPAVVAFSLLRAEKVFSHRDRERFIENVKAKLLVKKNGLPFGVLVKDSPKRTYYGDEEYHEGVVWPRDTPYLIRLLRYAGEREKETLEGLLKNNLAHQMTEGFVFYNNELFSPDNGDMTPVKNPVQFWSQWVDPYIVDL